MNPVQAISLLELQTHELTRMQSLEIAACIRNLVNSASPLVAFAECSEAIDQYNQPGSGWSAGQMLEVLESHGYVRHPGAFPLIGAEQFVAELRRKAVAKAKGGDA